MNEDRKGKGRFRSFFDNLVFRKEPEYESESFSMNRNEDDRDYTSNTNITEDLYGGHANTVTTDDGYYVEHNYSDDEKEEHSDMRQYNVGDEGTQIYSTDELVLIQPSFTLTENFVESELRDKLTDLFTNLKSGCVIHLDLTLLDTMTASTVEFATIGACAVLNYNISVISAGYYFLLTPKDMKVNRESSLKYSKSFEDRQDEEFRYSGDYSQE